MSIKNQGIFNEKLYPFLSNNYKIDDNEVESNFNDGKDNNFDIKELFINLDFLNDDELNEEIGNIENKKGENNKYEINKNKIKKKKKINKLKNYNIKKGDWLCPKCNNINFSFRVKCNICGINK